MKRGGTEGVVIKDRLLPRPSHLHHLDRFAVCFCILQAIWSQEGRDEADGNYVYEILLIVSLIDPETTVTTQSVNHISDVCKASQNTRPAMPILSSSLSIIVSSLTWCQCWMRNVVSDNTIAHQEV